MNRSVKETTVVSVAPQAIAEIVTGTLMRIGYQRICYHKIRAEFTGIDKGHEVIDQDYWSHDFRLRLSWTPHVSSTDGNGSGSSCVTVIVEDKDGGATDADCKKRCLEVISALQDDARQASEVSRWYRPSSVYGAANWASEEDLLEAGLITPYAYAERLILAPILDRFFLSLPERSSYHHAIVCGRTGVGKSTGFMIPNLIERTDVSMIVTEGTPGDKEQGELYRETAGWRASKGQSIYSFNPSDMSSTRINPIDIVRFATEREKIDCAEKLAALVIGNSQTENMRVDPTWDQSEKLLLTSLILHAAEIEEESGNFGYLRWLLLAGLKGVHRVLKTSPSERAGFEFAGWLNNTSKNFRFGVISGLLTKLNVFLTDNIVTLTSKTEIDLKKLRSERFTFYLSVPSTRKSMQSLGSLILNFLLDYLLTGDLDQPLALMLDEFTNFGYIPGIAERLAIVRKRRVAVVLGFQSFMQVEKVYGGRTGKIILDQPSCQVYFRQKNFDEAFRLSRALGRRTVEERRTQYDGRVSEQVAGRELISADELIRLPKETVIILTGDCEPIKTKKFAPDHYEAQRRLLPPQRDEHALSEPQKQFMESVKAKEADFKPDKPQKPIDYTKPVEPLNSQMSEEQEIAVERLRRARAKGSATSDEVFGLWHM